MKIRAAGAKVVKKLVTISGKSSWDASVRMGLLKPSAQH